MTPRTHRRSSGSANRRLSAFFSEIGATAADSFAQPLTEGRRSSPLSSPTKRRFWLSEPAPRKGLRLCSTTPIPPESRHPAAPPLEVSFEFALSARESKFRLRETGRARASLLQRVPRPESSRRLAAERDACASSPPFH